MYGSKLEAVKPPDFLHRESSSTQNASHLLGHRALRPGRGPSSQRLQQPWRRHLSAGAKEQEEEAFAVDWSVISPAGLGHVFKELLADLLGAPPPAADAYDYWRAPRQKTRKYRVDVDALYAQHPLRSSAQAGFLVRGLIFDMSALMRGAKAAAEKAPGPAPEQPLTGDQAVKEEVRELVKKHWEGIVGSDAEEGEASGKRTTQGASVEEITQQLGVEDLLARSGDRLNRAASQDPSAARPPPPPAAARAPKRSKDRALEELLGRGDSIRRKYEEKIQAKRILAESRREHGGVEGIPSAPRGKRAKMDAAAVDWVAMPGSAGLLKYFQERGLAQALLEEGKAEDRALLLDQLGEFPFQPTVPAAAATSDGPRSTQLLRSICNDWGLQPKQVMVVLGTGKQSQQILKAVHEAGFFVCQVATAYSLDPDDSRASLQATPLGGRAPAGGSPVNPLPAVTAATNVQRALQPAQLGPPEADVEQGSEIVKSSRAAHRTQRSGLLAWYTKLAEGTLGEESSIGKRKETGDIHFTVSDMIELKWVLEDLNGVSYRRSTFIRGQGSKPKS